MKQIGQISDPLLPHYPNDDADLAAWVAYSKVLHRKLDELFRDKQVKIDAVIPYTATANLGLTSDVTGAYPGNIKWVPALPPGLSTITTKDEGVSLSTGVTTLDFVGAGVTATGAGATTTVTIPGAGAATINTQDEGVALSATVTTLNFVGAGVVATGAGATTTVTIAGAAAGGGFDFGKAIATHLNRLGP